MNKKGKLGAIRYVVEFEYFPFNEFEYLNEEERQKLLDELKKRIDIVIKNMQKIKK